MRNLKNLKNHLIVLIVFFILSLIVNQFFQIIGNLMILAGIVGIFLIYLQEKRKTDPAHILEEKIKSGDLQDVNKDDFVGESAYGYILNVFTQTIRDFQESINEIKNLTNIVIETANESIEQSNLMAEVNLNVSRGAQL